MISLHFKLFIFLLLLTGFNGLVLAQTKVTGKVIDEQTHETLPFVNIGVNQSSRGTSTDIDGNFTITSSKQITSLQFSYVGYEKKEVLLKSTDTKITVRLKKKTVNLKEVVINPEENPALRIIRNVIENKKLNNIEERDYACNLYNKFTMNANVDTASSGFKATPENGYVYDSIAKKKVFKKLDSLEIIEQMNEKYADASYFNSTPIMMLETYVEKKHIAPNRNKELITASKMSGFKNPSFLALATKIQSFSFYDEIFAINNDEFLSPISKPGLRKYFYLIEDTLYSGLDTIFVISYRPYRGKVFNGMKGVLQISTNKYALKNVTAEPADSNAFTKVTIQQLYEEDSSKNWVPKQLLGRLEYPFLSVDEMKLNGEIKTYITDLDYTTKIKSREVDNLAFEIALDAHEVDSLEWSKLRATELTKGETFTVLDSLKDSIPVNFDRMLEFTKILMTGKIPYKNVSLDLNRLLTFNDFEGVRLGAGLHTNKRFSKWFQTGGYFAYGFKDKQWKYGADINFHLSERRDVDVNFSYQNDVIASGKTSFFAPQTAGIIPSDYSVMFINQMDNIEKYEGTFGFRALKHFKFTLFGNVQTRVTNNDYAYSRSVGDNITVEEQTFFISEYGVNVRFAFGETFYYDGMDRFSLGSKAPIVYGKLSKGFKSDYGNLAYTKYDFHLVDNFKIGRLGLTSVILNAGIVEGKIPYTLLYNPNGIYKPFSLSSNNAFETMRVNEFLSDKYANLFLGHKFKSFHFGKKFEPQLELVTNIGYGTLSNFEVHKNITFKTLENGFYESGLRIHNLLKINFTTIGIAGFYRYGPNSLGSFSKDVAAKFVVGFKL